jgi:hypothetical protein
MTVDSRGCHCLSVVVGPWCGRRMEVNCPGFGLVQRVTDQPCGFVIASIGTRRRGARDRDAVCQFRAIGGCYSIPYSYSVFVHLSSRSWQWMTRYSVATKAWCVTRSGCAFPPGRTRPERQKRFTVAVPWAWQCGLRVCVSLVRVPVLSWTLLATGTCASGV